MSKEELTEKLMQFHAVPYRNRQSAAEELATEICDLLTERYLQGMENGAKKKLVMKALN